MNQRDSSVSCFFLDSLVGSVVGKGAAYSWRAGFMRHSLSLAYLVKVSIVYLFDFILSRAGKQPSSVFNPQVPSVAELIAYADSRSAFLPSESW